ncbi:hypothetical protein J6590_047398 [Homalodisca vitripennis]|nr:hypothetical protein J6590_047398 [Homalodisca vitripennis]
MGTQNRVRYYSSTCGGGVIRLFPRYCCPRNWKQGTQTTIRRRAAVAAERYGYRLRCGRERTLADCLLLLTSTAAPRRSAAPRYTDGYVTSAGHGQGWL